MTPSRPSRAGWISLALTGLLLSVAACGNGRPGAALADPEPEVTAAESPEGQRARFLQMFVRGYYPARTAQVFFVPDEGHFLVARGDEDYPYMHGSPWSYDTEIPLLLYGPPFIRVGEYGGAATQQDVAPTLGRLLGLTGTPGMTGSVLAEAITDTNPPPRAAVLLIMDGLARTAFDLHGEAMPALSRLRREGAWFANAAVTTLPTQTAAGHATVATGTDPRLHGIVGNTFIDRWTATPSGPFPGLDPANLMAPSLADRLNLVTDGRAVIVGQGTAARAAVPLSGHGACQFGGRPVILAVYDESLGTWTTNEECYVLPAYLREMDARDLLETEGYVWEGHAIPDVSAARRAGLFSRFEADAAIAMIESEGVGRDAVPDLVSVNFKTPDYVAHKYGPDSPEMLEALAELDRQVARIVDTLVATAGVGEFVVAVTADHGMPPEPPVASERHYIDELLDLLHDRFDPDGRSLFEVYDPAAAQIVMHPARQEAFGVHAADVARFLESQSWIFAAFTEAELRESGAPAAADTP